jgi:hypothetical protein
MRNIFYLMFPITLLTGCYNKQPLVVTRNELISIIVLNIEKALWNYFVTETNNK